VDHELAPNKRTKSNCSEDTMVRVYWGQGRLQKWEWEPALALLYPNHCLLLRSVLLLEANISDVLPCSALPRGLLVSCSSQKVEK